jgi:hypothetical protein
MQGLVRGGMRAAVAALWIYGGAAAYAQSGYQTINGTRVFTQIDQARGVATFSNECGSQTLTQSELQGGAIPDQIIPCPRPGAHRESDDTQRSRPAPQFDERAEPRARSRRLVTEGDGFYDRKQYRQAIQKYEEAKKIQLAANLVTLYQITKLKAERATCLIQIDSALRQGSAGAKQEALGAAQTTVCRRFPDFVSAARATVGRGADTAPRQDKAVVLCGSLVGTGTEFAGLKSDMTREVVNCVTVENKCPYTISFTVRIDGLPRDSQNLAEHGKTAKICASKEGQGIRYTGMMRRP